VLAVFLADRLVSRSAVLDTAAAVESDGAGTYFVSHLPRLISPARWCWRLNPSRCAQNCGCFACWPCPRYGVLLRRGDRVSTPLNSACQRLTMSGEWPSGCSYDPRTVLRCCGGDSPGGQVVDHIIPAQADGSDFVGVCSRPAGCWSALLPIGCPLSAWLVSSPFAACFACCWVGAGGDAA